MFSRNLDILLCKNWICQNKCIINKIPLKQLQKVKFATFSSLSLMPKFVKLGEQIDAPSKLRYSNDEAEVNSDRKTLADQIRESEGMYNLLVHINY